MKLLPTPRLRRTSRGKRVVLALLFAVVLGGCDAAWPAYEQIELGKPLPKRHLLLRQGQQEHERLVWASRATASFPPALLGDSLLVVRDKNGSVTAKVYVAGAVTHWILCQWAACRLVMEVQIPEEAFRDPPAGWKEPAMPGTDRMSRIVKRLSPLVVEVETAEPLSTAWDGPDRSLLTGEVTASLAVRIHPRRLGKRISKMVQAGPTDIAVDPAKDVDLTDLAGAEVLRGPGLETRIVAEKPDEVSLKVFLRIPFRPHKNVLEYLLGVPVHYPGLSAGETDLPEEVERIAHSFSLLLMIFPFKVTVVDDMAEVPGALAGITRDGYDWTYRNPHGGTLRIQNLGNRRLRIESKAFDLYDPFFLLGILKLMVGGQVAEHHLYNSAVAHLTRRVRDHPNSAEALLARACLYDAGHDYDRAIADYTRVLELEPAQSTAAAKRKDVLGRRDRYDRLIVTISREILMDPKSIRIWHWSERRNVGWDDDPDRGIADFTRVIKQKPGNPVAYNNRGVSYYHKRLYRKGVADFTRAIQLNPKYVKAYENRATLYYLRRQYRKAWPDARKAAELTGVADHRLVWMLRRVAPPRR